MCSPLLSSDFRLFFYPGQASRREVFCFFPRCILIQDNISDQIFLMFQFEVSLPPLVAFFFLTRSFLPWAFPFTWDRRSFSRSRGKKKRREKEKKSWKKNIYSSFLPFTRQKWWPRLGHLYRANRPRWIGITAFSQWAGPFMPLWDSGPKSKIPVERTD